jgi:GGDEF domain-containing protein
VSIYPDHAGDASTLIRIADKAMYHAKQSGRNTYRFYDESMKA